MTAYLAGPMSGLPDFNYPTFTTVAAELRTAGVDVVNPAELFDGDTGRDRAHYIREGIRALLGCDHIILLPGWRDSPGALTELAVAHELGMAVTEWQPGTGDQVHQLERGSNA